MVDDHLQIGMTIQQRRQIAQSRRWKQERHWHSQGLTPLPEWRHESSANPVSFDTCCGTQSNAPAALPRPFGEMVWRSGVLWIDAAYPDEQLGESPKAVHKIAVVPAIVDDLNEHGAIDLVRFHASDQSLDAGIQVRWNLRAFSKRKPGGTARARCPDMHMRINAGVSNRCAPCQRRRRDAGYKIATSPGWSKTIHGLPHFQEDTRNACVRGIPHAENTSYCDIDD
jgi:hypothetical protein